MAASKLILNITKVIPNWSWILPKWSWVLLNITKYYSILPILPILHKTETQIFTNISQYYMANIHQYYISGIWSQYYTILPICPNITWSILLNIPNPQNSEFLIQYVSIFINITWLIQYYSIFINITWVTCRCLAGLNPTASPSHFK